MHDSLATKGARAPGVKVTKRPPRRKAARKNVPVTVTKSMTVAEIVERYPQSAETLALYGLHCFGCAASGIESLEEGCRGHGFTEEEIDALVADLNESIALLPPRPETLMITESAAIKIEEIAKSEDRVGQGLVVEADEHGGFYMEFREKPELGEKIFLPVSGPQIHIFASTLTLQRIGGSTIDVREGRFKLDLETDTAGCACGGECGCK